MGFKKALALELLQLVSFPGSIFEVVERAGLPACPDALRAKHWFLRDGFKAAVYLTKVMILGKREI